MTATTSDIFAPPCLSPDRRAAPTPSEDPPCRNLGELLRSSSEPPPFSSPGVRWREVPAVGMIFDREALINEVLQRLALI
jgi:hypothetical protein